MGVVVEIWRLIIKKFPPDSTYFNNGCSGRNLEINYQAKFTVIDRYLTNFKTIIL